MKQNSKALLRGVVGVGIMMVLGAMYAWSYFKVALGAVYPSWSQTQITLNFTILMSVFCLGGLLAGSGMKKLSKTAQILISAVLVGAGFLGTSFLPEDPALARVQLYLCYGVCTGLGTGIAYNAVLSGVQPWFPNATGRISGVLLMGMGFGSLILGNVAAKLLEVCSLAVTFRIFALGSALLLLAGAAVIRLPRSGEVEAAKISGQPEERRSYTTGEMLRRPTFWLYFFWNIIFSAGGLLVINAASSISLYYGLAAVIGLLVSVFNGLGRLGIGSCMDALGWKKTMYLNNIILLVSGVLLLIGDHSGSGAVVLAGMLVMGICYGGGITISAALIRTLYGSKYYAGNFSVCNLCSIPGSIFGPMVSAALQDGSGGYHSTFVLVMVMGCAALGLNVFIRKP